MKDWKNIIQEEVSREHREKVMSAASIFLKENALRDKEGAGKRFFLKGLLGSLAAAAAAFVVVIRPGLHRKNETQHETSHEIANSGTQSNGNSVSSDFLAMTPVLQVNLDLLANLDMIEDLEVLEKWEPDKV